MAVTNESLTQELSRTNETALLDARVGQLSQQQFISFAERAELAAILVLRKRGSIVLRDIWEVLLGYYGYRQLYWNSLEEQEFLQPVCRDLETVRDNLTLLLGGEEIPSEPEYDPNSMELRPLPQWMIDGMRSLNAALARYEEYVHDLGPYLPSKLRENLAFETLERSFDSAVGVGIALEALPHGGVSWAGYEGQGLYVFEALLDALEKAIQDYQKATTATQESIRHRLELWAWIMRGFTASMMADESSTIRFLTNRQAYVDRLESALLTSRDLLRNGENVYRGPRYEGAKAAADLKTETLVKGVAACVERNRQAQAVFRAAR